MPQDPQGMVELFSNVLPMSCGGVRLQALCTQFSRFLASYVTEDEFRCCCESAVQAIVNGNGREWRTQICRHGCIVELTLGSHFAKPSLWHFELDSRTANGMHLDINGASRPKRRRLA